ncbi:MAG: zinc-ribbon domain-containing protein [Rhodobacteraceae bacterium]|nr:zinc-ribbon domain-containing protein [Paracoccaceae bacterium]
MYEVPDSVIPADGRDVQCSNCGKAWFFSPVTPAMAEMEEAHDVAPAPAPPAPEPTPEAEAEPEAAPAETAPEAAPAARPEPAPEPATPRRRPLDNSVADVLREEAAFEARARAEDAGLEFQDDLPLEEPASGPATDDYVEAEPETTAGGASSRRNLLPDIDEINSTLRATSERAATEAVSAGVAGTLTRRRQGFRTGFGLALIVLATLTFGYTTADTLTERLPAAGPILDSYVATVNSGRGWLQAAVEGLVQRMGA